LKKQERTLSRMRTESKKNDLTGRGMRSRNQRHPPSVLSTIRYWPGLTLGGLI
jgi:hypothetical protein